jgi:hypothetical protein
MKSIDLGEAVGFVKGSATYLMIVVGEAEITVVVPPGPVTVDAL